MYTRRTTVFVAPGVALTVLALLVFVLLHLLQAPAGRLIDWLVGIASFWWLLVIVTVPWNIHFEARQVLVDAADSAEPGILT